MLISEDFPYTNPNLDARKKLDDKARTNAASYPADDAKLELFKDIGAMGSKVDEVFTAVKGQ